MDKNGNGKIDNQNELFGNDDTYADGFLNLAQYDSNHDGVMNAADAQWNNLRVAAVIAHEMGHHLANHNEEKQQNAANHFSKFYNYGP